MKTNGVLLFAMLLLSFNGFCNDGFLNFIKKEVAPKERQLYIFYRTDCPYCQQMDVAIEKDAAFQQALAQQYTLIAIDIQSTEGKMLAKQFNVRAVPTLVTYHTTNGAFTITQGFGNLNRLSKALHLNYQQPSIEKTTPRYQTADICGNGILEAGEACDDGNANSNDGCTNFCTIQAGFSCSGSPSVCVANCGDGIVALSGGEACDDGNTSNGDGCSNVCSVEVGYTCSGSPSSCSAICGDGIVAVSAGEACDDGNNSNGDGCSNACSIETGYNCTGSPSTCTLAPPTNDNCSGASLFNGTSGILSANNSLASNSLNASPSCKSNWQKDVWYQFTLTNARPIRIAINGVSMLDPVLTLYTGSCTNLSEVGCDDNSGPGNSALYQGNLLPGSYFVRVLGSDFSGASGVGSFNVEFDLNTAICGNNVVDFGESCDDGNLTNGDGCSSSCTFETNNTGSASKGVAVNLDATGPNPAAILDVKANDKGILIPRLTTAQRLAIVNPVNGLTAFDVTTNSFWYFKSSAWVEINSSANIGFCAVSSTPQAFSASFLPALTTEQFDDGNNFSTTSTSFTAPTTSLYSLQADVTLNLVSTSAQTVITLVIEDKTTLTKYSSNSVIVPAGFTGALSINTASQANVSAGAALGIKMLVTGTLGNQSLSFVSFCGHKVY